MRLCREHAAREDWAVAGSHHDAGVSGASLVLRPGIQQLLRDAQGGRFEIVLAEAARPPVARPGRRRHALQAAQVLRRRDRHFGRGGDLRTACRAQGHDERAVPERPGAEDAARPARPCRGRQIRRRAVLRLPRRQAARCRRRRPQRRAHHRR
ncbi:recombinase family protein [Pseudaminobacter soli (ex Li et al. 2025)]|uniref:recombinase family protein n=1 Tax=Pseudaminobacter soli (ex Li et al. 2025) TaxID=1295366 RepID=UPI003159B1AB